MTFETQGGSEAPVGEVSLVFVAPSGLAELRRADPEAGAAAAERSTARLRASVRAHGGYEVKEKDGGFMLAFGSAAAALGFALDAEGEAGLPLRLGVNRGRPVVRRDPGTGLIDYFGPVVNRAARLCAAANPGQRVASGESLGGVEVGALGAVITPLGEHALRGVSEPVAVYQLRLASEGSRDFPPLRSPVRRRTNLSPESDAIGRREEAAALGARLLASPGLVTLLGPAGAGKTTLARAAAGRVLAAGALPGGVWFCDLSAVRSAEGLRTAVAGVLEVPLAAREGSAQLGRALRARTGTVVVLDNFEQMDIEAAETVAGWLEAAPELRVLVTSRRPLRVDGEGCTEVERLSADAARRIFIARAEASRGGFDPGEEDLAAIDEIVRRLDHNPLALSLAAARCGVLSPRQILDRLGRSLDLLRAPRGGGVSRHATLRAAIRWSWELLDAPARAALAAASVFAGGVPASAGEVLGADDATLARLVDGSLLGWIPPEWEGSEGRYGISASVQLFAAEQLAADRRGPLREAHAHWYARRVAEQPDLRWCAAERHDLERAVENGEPVDAARTALALDALCASMGPVEGREERLLGVASRLGPRDGSLRIRLELARAAALLQAARPAEALEVLSAARREVDPEADPATWALLELRAGGYLALTGHPEGVLEALRRAGPGLTEPRELARAANLRGTASMELGRVAEAQEALRESAARYAAFGDDRSEALVLANLALLELDAGDPGAARRALELAHERLVGVGDTRWSLVCRGNLALVDLLVGRVAEARAGFDAAIGSMEPLGMRRMRGYLTAYRAAAEALAGDIEAAERSLRRSEELASPTADDALDRVRGLYRRLASGQPPPPPGEEPLEVRLARRLFPRPTP